MSERSTLSIITSNFLENSEEVVQSIDACLLLDFTEWYHPLQQFTFNSAVIPLTPSQAKAISLKYASVEDRDMKIPIQSTSQQELDALRLQIDEAMGNLGYESCFIKLNSRSPKDYACSENNKKSLELFKEKLTILEGKNLEHNLENQIIYEFLKVQPECLRIRSGKEALKLLYNSKRISVDLDRCIQLSRNLLEFPGYLVVRRFEAIDPQWEFRGFVYKDKLTAVSQYFDFCYFSELNKRKQEIENRIVEFYNTSVYKKIPHDSFVIDFGILDNGSVIVIELNPFTRGSGTAMFSWKNQQDREILLGKRAFEFRILTKPKDSPLEYLLTSFKEIAMDIL